MAHIVKLLTATAHGSDKTGDTFHFQHYYDEAGGYQISQDHTSGGAVAVYKIQGRMTDEHQWTDIVTSGSLNSTSAAKNEAGTLTIFPQMRAFLDFTSGTVTSIVTIYD